jgi:hypothetical protein
MSKIMTKDRIGKVLRDMGPLMLIALVVPGGTLIAGLIYLLAKLKDANRSRHSS